MIISFPVEFHHTAVQQEAIARRMKEKLIDFELIFMQGPIDIKMITSKDSDLRLFNIESESLENLKALIEQK